MDKGQEKGGLLAFWKGETEIWSATLQLHTTLFKHPKTLSWKNICHPWSKEQNLGFLISRVFLVVGSKSRVFSLILPLSGTVNLSCFWMQWLTFNKKDRKQDQCIIRWDFLLGGDRSHLECRWVGENVTRFQDKNQLFKMEKTSLILGWIWCFVSFSRVCKCQLKKQF